LKGDNVVKFLLRGKYKKKRVSTIELTFLESINTRAIFTATALLGITPGAVLSP
jgi:hypothetical protein